MRFSQHDTCTHLRLTVSTAYELGRCKSNHDSEVVFCGVLLYPDLWAEEYFRNVIWKRVSGAASQRPHPDQVQARMRDQK